MEATIKYPSRNFLKVSLRQLRAGADTHIQVRHGWRSALLEKEMARLPLSALEAAEAKAIGKGPPSLRMALLLMPLSIVHHFALSGDFIASMRKDADGGGVRISYTR